MSSDKIPIAVDIQIRIAQTGSLKVMISDSQQLNKEIVGMSSATTQMGKTSGSSRSSVRGLAFDLRLVSSGLSVLKTEFGGFSPVVDSAIGGMRILSGALSAGLGTISFVSRATESLNKEFGGLSGLLGSASGGMAKLTASGAAFGVIVGAVIGLSLGTWYGEWSTGIADMKSDVKDLNKELDAYKFRLLGLQDVQAGYREDQALLNMVIQQTEYSIGQQGYATELQSATLLAAQNQTKRLGVSNAVLAYELAQVDTKAGGATRQIERYGLEIKRIEVGAKEILLGGGRRGPGGMQSGNLPGGKLGGEVGRTGPIWAEAGEVIMQKEQMATMMSQGGGGGAISVSISLPGAIINSGDDLEGALARGGRRAGSELMRALDMDRYRIQRRG